MQVHYKASWLKAVASISKFGEGEMSCIVTI